MDTFDVRQMPISVCVTQVLGQYSYNTFPVPYEKKEHVEFAK